MSVIIQRAGRILRAKPTNVPPLPAGKATDSLLKKQIMHMQQYFRIFFQFFYKRALSGHLCVLLIKHRNNRLYRRFAPAKMRCFYGENCWKKKKVKNNQILTTS